MNRGLQLVLFVFGLIVGTAVFHVAREVQAAGPDRLHEAVRDVSRELREIRLELQRLRRGQCP